MRTLWLQFRCTKCFKVWDNPEATPTDEGGNWNALICAAENVLCEDCGGTARLLVDETPQVATGWDTNAICDQLQAISDDETPRVFEGLLSSLMSTLTWNTTWNTPMPTIEEMAEEIRRMKEEMNRIPVVPDRIVVSQAVHHRLLIHVGFANDHPQLYRKRFGTLGHKAWRTERNRQHSAQARYYRKAKKHGRTPVTSTPKSIWPELVTLHLDQGATMKLYTQDPTS